MNLPHYIYLYAGYGVALLCWFVVSNYLKLGKSILAQGDDHINFKRPWLEFIFSIIAVVCVILVGQLFVRGWLFEGGVIADSINQILIFTPIVLLLPIRRQSWQTALFPRKGKLFSVLIGFGIAVISLIVFMVLKGHNGNGILKNLLFIYHYDNLDVLVQVFLEDFAIAVVLYRLIQCIGLKRAVIVVAVLFAAAHIPAMVANGVSAENFIGLLFDTVLGILILRTLYSSRNFLWFWMIHFAMDLTQFL